MDKASFIDEEEQRQHHRQENAEDGQKGEKVQGHGKEIEIR
jgi:hypothetical protein